MTKEFDRLRFQQQQQQTQQKIYPDHLIQNEVSSHKQVVSEYYKELSINFFEMADKYKPDINLIKQQPQLTSNYRAPLLDFLFKISKRTRVCPEIFYKAIRLLDRYCSKRIVLIEQAQLVLTTCLWLVAKTEGGCNHCSPQQGGGGRFLGPTMRARIPRLSELCQLCGPSCSYDEGMFVQMERHILDTLNWEVTEPGIYEWCFNIEDNNLMTNYLTTRQKESVYLKQFIVDCSLYSHNLISTHPAELAASIEDIFQNLHARLTPSLLLSQQQQHQQELPKLILPSTNIDITEKLLQSITKASETLISNYASLTSQEFIKNYMQQSYYYLISIQKTKKRSLSDSSSLASTSTPSKKSSVSSSPSSYYDSEEDSDTDSLFDHIVNHSMTFSSGGSRTPSPLPSPDKIMFNANKMLLKRQHSGSTSPFLNPRRMYV